MKKIYILISCLMLFIMTLGFNVNASMSNTTISVESITAGEEESIEVPVKIVNNKGLIGVTVTITYDQALTLTGVTEGDAFSSLTMTKPGDLTEKCIKILWDGMEEDASDGIIAILTFDKPEEIGTYNIELSYEEGDIVDGNFNLVDVNTINGSIVVNTFSGEDEKDSCEINGHEGGHATCVHKAVCDVCGKEYGQVDKNNHEGDTEIRGVQKSTCEKAGYTGDKYCKACNTKIEDGSEISATGHTIVVDPAIPATTSKPGKTEGKHCATCKTVFVPQVVIPAKGQIVVRPYIKLSATTLPLQVKKFTNVLKVVSKKKDDSIAYFKSSNPKIVSVNAKTGKMVGKKEGKAVITVALRSGVKATCTVKVQKKPVTTKSIKISSKKIVMKRGSKKTISIVLNPLTSTDKIKVISSNKKVATVTDKGVIKANKKGTAKITIKSGNKKVTCTVIVN